MKGVKLVVDTPCRTSVVSMPRAKPRWLFALPKMAIVLRLVSSPLYQAETSIGFVVELLEGAALRAARQHSFAMLVPLPCGPQLWLH